MAPRHASFCFRFLAKHILYAPSPRSSPPPHVFTLHSAWLLATPPFAFASLPNIFYMLRRLVPRLLRTIPTFATAHLTAAPCSLHFLVSAPFAPTSLTPRVKTLVTSRLLAATTPYLTLQTVAFVPRLPGRRASHDSYISSDPPRQPKLTGWVCLFANFSRCQNYSHISDASRKTIGQYHRPSIFASPVLPNLDTEPLTS
jgi:hypothetical protein